jgi:hypothetical protein
MIHKFQKTVPQLQEMKTTVITLDSQFPFLLLDPPNRVPLVLVDPIVNVVDPQVDPEVELPQTSGTPSSNDPKVDVMDPEVDHVMDPIVD